MSHRLGFIITAARILLAAGLLAVAGCGGVGAQPAGNASAASARAATAMPIPNESIVVTRGPVILRNPGLPIVVIRTTQDDGSPSLPADVLADPDLTTITVPAGTRITRNVGGNPRSLRISTNPEHAKGRISVHSVGDLVYNLDMRSETASEATEPVQSP